MLGEEELEEVVLALGEEDFDNTDSMGNEDLLGALKKAKRLKNPTKRARATKKISKTLKNRQMSAGLTTGSMANIEFQKRIKMLPSHIQKAIANGSMQVVDKTFYSQKYVGGLSNVDMFTSGDKKQEGFGNLLQGRLGANDYFLVTEIRLLSATDESITSLETSMGADFKKDTNLCPQIANGEYRLLNEQTNYADETSCQVFNHGRTDIPFGTYVLKTPKLFKANRSIKFDMKFAASAPAGTAVRVELNGLLTVQGAN